MEADEVLTKAWAAVQASGVPESLYDTAFKEAVSVLAGSRPQKKKVADDVVDERTKPNTEDAEGAATETQSNSEGKEDRLKKLSDETDIPEDELAEVLFFDGDGTVHLNVPARKLGGSGATQARSIATALAAAYYYVDNEPQTAASIVQTECARLKCYDSKNFYVHMGKAPGVILSGSGASRVLKPKSGEIKAALRAMVDSVRGVQE